jgi:hypothetical protein
MPQMIGLLVLAGALPLLWLALRTDRAPNEREDGEETPAWAIAAAQGGASNAVDLHDVVLQMRTIPRLFKPVMERFGKAIQRVTPGGIGSGLERAVNLCGLQGRVSVTTLLAAKAMTTVVGVVAGGYVFFTWTGK